MTSVEESSNIITSNGSVKDRRMTQEQKSHVLVKGTVANTKQIIQNKCNDQNSKGNSIDDNMNGENIENIPQRKRASCLENSLTNDTDVSSNVAFHRRRVELTPRGLRRSDAISPITPHKNNVSVSSIDNSNVYVNVSKQDVTKATGTQRKVIQTTLAKNELNVVNNKENVNRNNDVINNSHASRSKGAVKQLNNHCQNNVVGEINKQDQDNANGVNEVVRTRAVRMDTACYISPARSNSSSREVVNAVDKNMPSSTNAVKLNNIKPLNEITKDNVIRNEMPMQQEREVSMENEGPLSHHHHHHHRHRHSNPHSHRRHYHRHHRNYSSHHRRHHVGDDDSDSDINYNNENNEYHKSTQEVKEESNILSNHPSRRRAYSHMIPRGKHNSQTREPAPQSSKSNQPRETAIESQQNKSTHESKNQSNSFINMTEPNEVKRTRSYTAHVNRVHDNSASPTQHYSSRSNTQTRDNSRIYGNYFYSSHSSMNNINDSSNNNPIRYLVIPAMPVQRNSVIIPTRRVNANSNAPAVWLTGVNTNNPEYINYVWNRRTMQSISVPATNRNNSQRSTVNSNRTNDKTTSTTNPHNASKEEVHSFITRATPVLGKMDEAGDAQNTTVKSTLCDSIDGNNTNLSMEDTHLSKSKSLLYSPLPRTQGKEQVNKESKDAIVNDNCTSEVSTSLHSNEMERRIMESKAWVESMKRKLSSKRRHGSKKKDANNDNTTESEKPITVQREHTHKKRMYERHSTNVAVQEKYKANYETAVKESSNIVQKESKKYCRHYTEIMFPSSSSSSSSSSESSSPSSSSSLRHETGVKGSKSTHLKNETSNSVNKTRAMQTKDKVNGSSINVKENKESNIEKIYTDNRCEAVEFAKQQSDVFNYHNLQLHKELMAKAQKERKPNITPITVTLDERESRGMVAVHLSNNSELNASDTDDQLKHHHNVKRVPDAIKLSNKEVNTTHEQCTENKDIPTSQRVLSSTNVSDMVAAPFSESSVKNSDAVNNCERDVKEIITKNGNQGEEEIKEQVDNINTNCAMSHVDSEIHSTNSEMETKTQPEPHSDVHPVTFDSVEFVSFLDLHTFPTTEELCDYNVNVAEMLSDEELDALREVVFNHDEVYFAELLYADDVQSELTVIEKILDSGDDSQKKEIIHLYCTAVDTFNTRCKSAHNLLLTIGEPLVSNIALFAKEYVKQK